MKKKKKSKKDKHEKIINKYEKLIQKEKQNEDGDKYDILFKKILFNSNNLWFPNKNNKLNDKIYDNKGTEYSSHSWFNITEYTSNLVNNNYDANIPIPIIDELIKCQKIKIYENKLQKKLLLNWMKSYTIMYNETIKIFKKFRFNKQKTILNWKKLRTNFLKDIKKDIIEKSQLKTEQINTKVNGHILDFAIQDACSKLKSCITNLKNGHIK